MFCAIILQLSCRQHPCALLFSASSTLEIIGDFQDQLNHVQTLQRTFPLVARREGGIGDEFVAFLNMMLFNTSRSSQV